MNQERMIKASHRIATLMTKPGSTTFQEWAMALLLVSVNTAQYVGEPKAAFLERVSGCWDWSESQPSPGDPQGGEP